MLYERYIKRLIDIVAVLVLLVPGVVLMGMVAAYIRLRMGKGVLFRQERPGYKGKVFTLYKFRTMREVYDENGSPLPDEERLTAVGRIIRKASLDELPQLFNVLKGDMSLVGPRPLLVEYLPLYNEEQKRRHDVRPGITGWAQVNGRNAISWEEKFDLDVWYVDNVSLLLDIKILFLTALKVVGAKDVNQTEAKPMEKFTGSD